MPGTRGHIEFRVDDCSFCTICAHKCPTQAIQVHKQDKTWAIDHGRCILCGLCVEDCRAGCITLSPFPCPPMRAKEVLSFRQEHTPPPARETVAVAPPSSSTEFDRSP
jgi:Formate hydrogenlyase subunit 6/NADH:ubiquinone oxidoreductase 23 kD subunit (chain I)